MTIPHMLNEGKTAYHMPLHGLLGLFGEPASSMRVNKAKKNALYLSVNVFSMKVLIGDTVFVSTT